MHASIIDDFNSLFYFSNGTMLRLRGNNRQLVSNKPGGTSRVTGPNNNSSSSSSTPPIRNTSSGTANRLSRITPPAGAGPVAPSRSLQDCAGSLLSVLFSLLGSPSLLCIYSRPIHCCVTWYLQGRMNSYIQHALHFSFSHWVIYILLYIIRRSTIALTRELSGILKNFYHFIYSLN